MGRGQSINAAMTTGDRLTLAVGATRGITCEGLKGRPWVR